MLDLELSAPIKLYTQADQHDLCNSTPLVSRRATREADDAWLRGEEEEIAVEDERRRIVKACSREFLQGSLAKLIGNEVSGQSDKDRAESMWWYGEGNAESIDNEEEEEAVHGYLSYDFDASQGRPSMNIVFSESPPSESCSSTRSRASTSRSRASTSGAVMKDTSSSRRGRLSPPPQPRSAGQENEEDSDSDSDDLESNSALMCAKPSFVPVRRRTASDSSRRRGPFATESSDSDGEEDKVCAKNSLADRARGRRESPCSAKWQDDDCDDEKMRHKLSNQVVSVRSAKASALLATLNQGDDDLDEEDEEEEHVLHVPFPPGARPAKSALKSPVSMREGTEDATEDASQQEENNFFGWVTTTITDIFVQKKEVRFV